MNKKAVTVIMIQAVLIIICLVNAFVKNVEAAKNFEEAEVQRLLADKSAMMAEAAAKEAVIQRGIASELRGILEKCCKK